MKIYSGIALIAFISLFSYSLPAQYLYGFVIEQNSGRKPVEGVRIKSTFGANQVTTTTKGDYRLTFQDGQPGKSVLLVVEKENWIITDKEKLETNLPEDPLNHPHIIVLCRQEVWEQQKKDYKTLLNNYIKQSYEREKASLNQQDKHYRKLIDSLQDKFTRLERELNELAELYSRTNLDELTGVEKNAFALFKEGNIDECILLRKNLESEKNFLKAKGKEKRLDSLGRQIDTARFVNNKALELHKRNLLEEVTLAKLKYDFKTAEQKMEFLAVNDTSDFHSAFTFAAFLQKQNKLDKAFVWNNKALSRAKEDVEKGIILCNLGVLYNNQKKYGQAIAMYEKASDFYRNYLQENPGTIEFGLAIALNNLGLAYIKENRYPDAEKIFTEVLSIYKRLAEKDPGNIQYLSEFAGVLINIGILNSYENDFAAAEKNLLLSLDTHQRLAKEHPEACEPGLAEACLSLGDFYRRQDNYSSAETYYLQSLAIYKRFAKNNANEYKLNVAETLGKMGILYDENQNYAAAENSFNEALEIWQDLARNYSFAYWLDAAKTFNELGILHAHNNNVSKSEEAFQQSLAAYRELVKEDSRVYLPELGDALGNMGRFYRQMKNYSAANNAILEALDIYKYLFKNRSPLYEIEVAAMLSNLGILDYKKMDYTASESHLLESINTYSRHLKNFSREDKLEYSYTVVMLGYLYGQNPAPNIIEEYFKNSPVADSILLAFPNDNAIKVAKQELDIKLTDPELIKIDAFKKKVEQTKSNKEKINLQQQIVEAERQLTRKHEKVYAVTLGNDLGNLSWNLLFEKQFAGSEKAAREALFPSYKNLPADYAIEMEWVNTNLALALLFQGKYTEAEKIYLSLKSKTFREATYREAFLADLDELEKAGIKHKDAEKIRALLKQ